MKILILISLLMALNTTPVSAANMNQANVDYDAPQANTVQVTKDGVYGWAEFRILTDSKITNSMYVAVYNKDTQEEYTFLLHSENKFINCSKLPVGSYDVIECGVYGQPIVFDAGDISFDIKDLQKSTIIEINLDSINSDTESNDTQYKDSNSTSSPSTEYRDYGLDTAPKEDAYPNSQDTASETEYSFVKNNLFTFIMFGGGVVCILIFWKKKYTIDD